MKDCFLPRGDFGWIRVLLVLVFACSISACEEGGPLYEDIPTAITGTEIKSHSAPGYIAVPDSLRLRFQRQLRMLRCTVVAVGCDPHLETRLEATSTLLTVRFDMNNACVSDAPVYFDVDLYISPVHPDEFDLIVEQVDFAAGDSTFRQVMLSQHVNVRTLPGF